MIDENAEKASALLKIIAWGGINASYTTTDNTSVVGILYDSKGELVKKYTYSNQSLSINELPDGDYTLVSMANSTFFNSILKLSQLAASGLVEGTDYVQSTVTVKSGILSSIANSHIPALDESKLYYTGDNTSFTVNKASIVAGNYLTLKGKIDFKEEYAGSVSNVQLVVDLPESCSYVENSVMAGNSIASYTLDNNRLTIPLANYTDLVRFCVIPTAGGSYQPNAFVEFTLNGKEVSQPIGSAFYEVKDLSISVPKIVAKTTIPISGTAQGSSEISIYDNDILIGQTTSLANGVWNVSCELNNPYNLSTHSIYAKVTTKQGMGLQSETKECQYDKDAIEPSTVTMTFYNGWLKQNVEVVFDFQSNTTNASSYMFYTATDITFIIDLTNNNPEVVSNVVLNVFTDQNETRKLIATYDNKKEKWIATSNFSSNNLPINLSVDFDADTIGTYSIYFTASKDGYSVSSNPKMLTVTKLNLSKAVITFPNGNESVYQPYNTTTGVPPYVVTYNGSELKAGVDYTVVRGDSRSTVGAATLTIKATDDGDYTGQKTARWTVAAHKATISVGDIIKAYDGTTDLPANASIKLKSADSRYAPSGGPLPLVAGEDYQILNASYDSANASEDEKAVSFTIKLTDRNYTFEDGTTQKDFVLNGADVSQTFKINQATVTPDEITQLVFNDLAKTYEIDLRTLLPELPVGCEYGKIHNRGCDSLFTDNTYLDSSNHIFVSNEGILTLPIVAAHSANVNDQIGTLTVPIVSTNYQPFELTIKVVIGQRIPLDQSGVSVSATDITYGQTLAESTLTATGSMICPRTQAVIPGTFAWKDGTIKPNAGSYDAEWTFTPAEGYEEYAPATGTVTVTVEPAELTGVSVRAPSTYYTGKPQHASTIASGQSVDGTTVTFTYSDKVDGDYTSDGPTFTDAGTYTVYYKAEAANHKTATGTFTVTIAPLPISLLSVERISKSYDGTANVTLTASRLTFFSMAASRSGIILPDTALTFSDAQFTMKQADGSYLPSPDVGNGKALSFTMTLANDNYVFEGKPEGTKTVSDTFATDDTTRFTITKAAAPGLTAYPVTRKYTLKTEQTIPLPGLESLGMPGDAQVSDTNAFHSGSYSPAGKIEDGWGIDVNTGAITYTLAEGVAPGDVITFTLLVRSKNYEDATVTVILTLTERDAPILTLPDSITVDYTGAGIPVSAVTGKRAAFDGKDVPGTWSWKAGQTITNAADTGTKTIVFTPDDPVNYLPAEGTVSVTISPVAPAYTAPTAMDGLIYSGNAQALVNAGSTAHGKLLYSLSKDGAYSETIPTGTDAGEYTVWYKVAGDSNHTDTQPASVTVTVAPKAVTATVTVSGDSLSYTGDPLKPGVIVKDGDTVISPEEYDVSYRDNVNAGTATVTVRNKAGGNYTVSGGTTFEIGKAASDVKTAPGANTGLVYNGGEQTLVTTGTALGGKLKYRLGESGGFTEALPKAANAGTYTVYYMVEGDGNHRDSEIYSLTVTIGKARVTVTALDKRIYTGDKAPDLSKPALGKDYTVSAMFGEDALTGGIKLAYVDASGTEITPDTTKVGKVIIRAGGLTAPNDNYTVVFADGKLTVDERPVYTVKATAGRHGSITPSGNVDVLHGGSQTFTIAANSGYAISNVKIDGVSIGAVKSYTFENVTENHTIEVTFMKVNGNPQTGVMVDEVTGEYYVA